MPHQSGVTQPPKYVIENNLHPAITISNENYSVSVHPISTLWIWASFQDTHEKLVVRSGDGYEIVELNDPIGILQWWKTLSAVHTI